MSVPQPRNPGKAGGVISELALARAQRNTVVITVVDDRRIRYQALEAGATDFLIKPLDEHETRARCANLLELRRHKIVLSDQARVLQYQVDKSVQEIHERELETLSKLAKAGEFRDRTTANHLARM